MALRKQPLDSDLNLGSLIRFLTGLRVRKPGFPLIYWT